MNIKAAKHRLSRRLTFRGLPISIETDKGELRHWFDPHENKSGTTKMKVPYGYIRRTEGVDGDHVDCYVGPNARAKNVYVVHQMKAPEFTKYDEDKCMLGFLTAEDAKRMYLAHYNKPGFFGSMTTMPFEEFEKKVKATFEEPKKLASEIPPAAIERIRQVITKGHHLGLLGGATLGAGLGFGLASRRQGPPILDPHHRRRVLLSGLLGGVGGAALGRYAGTGVGLLVGTAREVPVHLARERAAAEAAKALASITKTAMYQQGTRAAHRALGLTKHADNLQDMNNDIALAGLATGAIGMGAEGLVRGGYATEKGLSKRIDRPALAQALNKPMNLPADLKLEMSQPHGLQSHYEPAVKTVRVSPDVTPGVLSHEFGHASGRKVPGYFKSKALGHLTGLAAAPLLYGVDPDSTAADVLTYGPSALFAPQLLEEGRASIRGFRGLRRAGGLRLAGKGVLSQLPAFLTYAAGATAPIVTGHIVRHLRRER